VERVTRLDANGLAVDYLLAARAGGAEVETLERRLADLPERALGRGLDDDAARVAFWLDIYNAAVVRAGAVDLLDRRVRWRYFGRRDLVIAGQRLSLDGIEHGLLRRSRWQLGLGYLGNPLPSEFERAHRVARVDPRIHFALNCGATSCPPIAAYERECLDEQLRLATKGYLRTETRRDGEMLRVPSLLLWYIGDFGGPPGIRRLLREAGIEGWSRRLRFSAWDWHPLPDNWVGDGDRVSAVPPARASARR
jgi:hypothetical protein